MLREHASSRALEDVKAVESPKNKRIENRVAIFGGKRTNQSGTYSPESENQARREVSFLKSSLKLQHSLEKET